MARTITYHVIDSEAYDKGYNDGYEVGKLDAFKLMKVDDKGYQIGYKDAMDKACEAHCNSICNAENPCDNKCGGYNRFVRELEGKV